MRARPRWTLIFDTLLLTCLLGWQFKAHCGGGWTDWEQYTTGCYSDATVFWGGRGVAAGELPYFQARMEYPVLTGALIWLEGRLASLLSGGAASFLFVATLVNAGLAMAVLRLFWRTAMDDWRLWAWAAAPPLILFVGHNWDMLAVILAVGAVLLARAGRTSAAAALAGLGVAAKLYPILVLPLIGLQALFAPDRPWPARFRQAALAVAAAVGAYGVVNLPVALAAFDNWSEFYRFSGERPPTASSVWATLYQFDLFQPDLLTLNSLATLLFVSGAALILALGWRRHQAHPWVLFTPVLAWFMLTNKVYSPQFDLWLYPLLLMTVRRPAPVLLFVVGDIAAYFAEFWFFAGQQGMTPAATPRDIAIATTLRGVAMLWIIIDAVRKPAPDWISRPDPASTRP